jgi:hypothetical protein
MSTRSVQLELEDLFEGKVERTEHHRERKEKEEEMKVRRWGVCGIILAWG